MPNSALIRKSGSSIRRASSIACSVQASRKEPGVPALQAILVIGISDFLALLAEQDDNEDVCGRK